jgi:hypothetical protein
MVITMAAAALVAACISPSGVSSHADANGTIFETNVTGNMNLFSGEPEITYDRTHPRNLAIVEFTLGSDARPAPAFSPDHSPGGGDPMIESGPDGSLYVAAEPFPNKVGSVATRVSTPSSSWPEQSGRSELRHARQ